MEGFENAPLGDGTCRPNTDVEATYVDVTRVINSINLPNVSIENSKILVGRKGSGKTHLLLHIKKLIDVKSQKSVYCALSNDIFFGKGTHAYRGDQTPEQMMIFWSSVWRICIYISVFSIFSSRRADDRSRGVLLRNAYNFYLDKDLDIVPQFRKFLEDKYEVFDWGFDDFRDPVHVLDIVLKKYRNFHSLSNFLLSVSIDDMERDVSVLLHDYGRVQFLVDGLDEFAVSDPRGWLDVQLGLFKAVFILSSIRSYTQYIGVTAAFRNYVYSRYLQDPQRDRGTSLIMKLNWDRVAARKFMEERLFAVREKNFARADKISGENPLSSWLGLKTISVPARGMREAIEDYVLRHTRLSPRNVVEIVNALCATLNDLEINNLSVNEDAIVDAVAKYARDVAGMMLQTASEEILANFTSQPKMQSGRGKGLADDVFVLAKISEALEALIANCGVEVVGRRKFNNAMNKFILECFEESEIGNKSALLGEVEGVLWRSGIIAYPSGNGVSKTNWRFAWSNGEMGYGRPPQGADKIGFHSAMIDLTSIKVHEDGPVF